MELISNGNYAGTGEMNSWNTFAVMEIQRRDGVILQQHQRILELEQELNTLHEYIHFTQWKDENAGLLIENAKAKFIGNNRYWSPSEHKMFLEGLNKYGRKNVKAISQYVGTRNPTQVRTHAQKYFAKIEKDKEKKGRRNNRKVDCEETDDSSIGSSGPSSPYDSPTMAHHQKVPTPLPLLPVKTQKKGSEMMLDDSKYGLSPNGYFNSRFFPPDLDEFLDTTSM